MIGSLAYWLGIRRRVALENLARAFPALPDGERRALARASYEQLGFSLREILWRRRPEVRFENWDIYLRAREPGRGVVCAIAHFGNFELLARAVHERGEKVTLIGRRLRGWFNRWLVRGRGIATLPDRDSTAAALQALRRREVLAIAVDQNMRPKRGVFVDFFGVPACTTPAAAVFSLRAGAPLIFAYPVRQPDGSHVVTIRGPFTTALKGHAAVVDVTQQVTRAVEAAVRERPDHWFWVHRRWKTRPQ
ncbi:MAG TPA: lysophospholipid acyltransferase family protein [Myxococcales bacterium]|nr:lysophospholipid acyltransferase family protein [Myxococcales bacterium]